MKLIKTCLFTILFILIHITAHAGEKRNWEYLTKSIDHMGDQAITNQLNKLGEKGWKLITCPAIDATLVCIFKRPKSK